MLFLADREHSLAMVMSVTGGVGRWPWWWGCHCYCGSASSAWLARLPTPLVLALSVTSLDLVPSGGGRVVNSGPREIFGL